MDIFLLFMLSSMSLRYVCFDIIYFYRKVNSSQLDDRKELKYNTQLKLTLNLNKIIPQDIPNLFTSLFVLPSF